MQPQCTHPTEPDQRIRVSGAPLSHLTSGVIREGTGRQKPPQAPPGATGGGSSGELRDSGQGQWDSPGIAVDWDPAAVRERGSHQKRSTEGGTARNTEETEQIKCSGTPVPCLRGWGGTGILPSVPGRIPSTESRNNLGNYF